MILRFFDIFPRAVPRLPSSIAPFVSTRSVGTRSLRPGAASLRAITHAPHVAGCRSPRPRHRVTTYSRLVKAARIPHAVTYGHCNLQAVANNKRERRARAVYRQPFDRLLSPKSSCNQRLIGSNGVSLPCTITLVWLSSAIVRIYGYLFRLLLSLARALARIMSRVIELGIMTRVMAVKS